MIFAVSIVVLDWMIHILHLTGFVPIVLMALRFRESSAAERWYMFALLMHLTAGFASVILHENSINPNYAGSTFGIVAVIFYAKFFEHAISLGSEKKILYMVAGAHVLFSFCNLMWLQKQTINTYTSISLAVIIISLSLIFFYRLLKNLPTDNLLSLPLFWFITAEFMTNTGQMLINSFAHFLINIFNDNLIILWILHHSLGIAGNLIITAGAWIVFKRGSRTVPG